MDNLELRQINFEDNSINDEYALIDEVKHELKPLKKHLKFIFIDEELQFISVKSTYEEIKQDIPYFSKKDLINAINYFNLYIKEVEFILSEDSLKC